MGKITKVQIQLEAITREAVSVLTTSLLTVLGAAGLAIGLALQGTPSNVTAGFVLPLFHRDGDRG